VTRYVSLGLPLTGDVGELSRAVDDELVKIADAIDHRFDQEESSEVLKAQEGMLRYFDATVYDPGLGSGEYVFTGGTWVKLASAAAVYTYVPFKAYTFRYLAGTGADPEASFNVFSVTDEGLGTYRVTVDQNTILGEDLLSVTVPLASVYPVNRPVGEGAVTIEISEFGTDANNRVYLEYHLSEFYVAGSMRVRDYILTAPEQLYGVGLANVQVEGAPDIPP
jgi:hypothetical protein